MGEVERLPDDGVDEIFFACVPEHVGEMDAHIDHWIAVANGDPDVPALGAVPQVVRDGRSE